MNDPAEAARLGQILRAGLSADTQPLYDVRVLRWMDGYRIEHPIHEGLNALEVLALRREEEGLPGTLAVFCVTPAPSRAPVPPEG